MKKFKHWCVLFFTFIIIALQPSVMVAQLNEHTVVNIEGPDEVMVVSGAEHFSITVKGFLNKKKYRLPENIDLFDYQIYIFVHPLMADGWWRQNPATARVNWEAQAYLGGTGRYSAKHGERFEIIAVLSKGTLQNKYDRPKTILKEAGTFRISDVKTVVTNRR